ncbi:MAG: hydrogenase iron-sulfur subunit [Deltaproteobacteria bacterium]|nr:hydrogenase iron-sulfur subunit [Deltaproteobacteria bacterium]
MNKADIKPNGMAAEMSNGQNPILAIFYCQNIPGGDEGSRQELESHYGESIRLFPIPCGGRLEPLHLLKALETFADAAFVIACPEGACRYFEGNRRAKKRVERTQAIIESIGLEKERLGILLGSREKPKTLSRWVKELSEQTSRLGVSKGRRL